jgi:hypothetical protein
MEVQIVEAWDTYRVELESVRSEPVDEVSEPAFISSMLIVGRFDSPYPCHVSSSIIAKLK